MMSERRQAIAFTCAWILALGGVWAAASAFLPSPVDPAGSIQTRLTIRGPDWTIEYEALSWNNTAFRQLREANLTLGFELDWVAYGWPYYDVLVTSINGSRSDGVADLHWQYCVNGTYATRGAWNQEIRSGDDVSWVYAHPGGAELCG